ncbi:hypothetical protein [Streptomyces yangpuensis]|uniref:hypothetical protein n=1 Tax=Streptomyces yangpuensis TaxID=1648182 RepID=UPI0036B861E6
MEHVWHVAVRIHPDDPTLPDGQWAEAAAAMVHAAGIAARGDEHAPPVGRRTLRDRPRILIIATLARQDAATHAPARPRHRKV